MLTFTLVKALIFSSYTSILKNVYFTKSEVIWCSWVVPYWNT